MFRSGIPVRIENVSLNEEISRSFPFRPRRLYWESILTTVDSFGGGLLCFLEIWKNCSAPAKHTGVFDFEIF